jgi:hypothetical protein
MLDGRHKDVVFISISMLGTHKEQARDVASKQAGEMKWEKEKWLCLRLRQVEDEEEEGEDGKS